jgi:hypothetical protein
MRFPGVITVPAFCVHTYFAPGGVSFTVERLWSHPARVCSWQRPLRFDPYTLGARGSEHISDISFKSRQDY